jgi:hypothetical protein
MSKERSKEFIQFTIKVIVVHCITYFVFGLLMSKLLNYADIFQREIIRDFMLPINSNTVVGVLVQPVRGLLFAVALWPLRRTILEMKHGWASLWLLFVVFSILSTTGAAPSSIEGMIYTRLPLWYHLIGLPEIALQTLAFSLLLIWWEKRPSNAGEASHDTRKGFFSELLMAVVIGCFAYIGYAVGSLALYFTAGSDVDFNQAAGDVQIHLMFVVAFILNVVYVLYISKKWLRNEIALWVLGLIAWALDGLAIYFYQWIFMGSSSLLVAMMIGLLPAGIITLSVRQNYRRTQIS